MSEEINTEQLVFQVTKEVRDRKRLRAVLKAAKMAIDLQSTQQIIECSLVPNLDQGVIMLRLEPVPDGLCESMKSILDNEYELTWTSKLLGPLAFPVDHVTMTIKDRTPPSEIQSLSSDHFQIQ